MATQEVVVNNVQNLANGIGLLPGQITRFGVEANRAEETLKRVQIVDGPTLSDAGTLKKALIRVIKDLDTSRKSFTDPLTNLAKMIKSDFDMAGSRLEVVKNALDKKMNAYVAAEEKRLQDQAEADAQAQASAALALAEQAQKEGDLEGADQILKQTTEISTQPVKVRADTGVYGTTVVSQKVISGEISDLRAFLSWASSGEGGGGLDAAELEQISVGKSLLNSLAKEAHGEGPGFIIPGLKVVVETKAR